MESLSSATDVMTFYFRQIVLEGRPPEVIPSHRFPFRLWMWRRRFPCCAEQFIQLF